MNRSSVKEPVGVMPPVYLLIVDCMPDFQQKFGYIIFHINIINLLDYPKKWNVNAPLHSQHIFILHRFLLPATDLSSDHGLYSEIDQTWALPT